MSEAAEILAALPEERLHEWVLEQRWFASKAREVAQLNVLESISLREDPPGLVLALVEARFQTGTHELYQLPLGLRPAREGWGERVVAEVDGWTVYDALADGAQGREMLHRVRGSNDVAADDGSLHFRWAESAAPGIGGTVDVRPVGVEQSNSSIVFSDSLILKAFRRVEPGENPELELLRWMRRFIALRKEHPVFGLGTYEPLEPSNSKIFAHLRVYEDDVMLCVHNLARSAQAVELDLASFAGKVPEEMFGRTRFPPVGELPYLLTFGPRGFFWFQLRQEEQVE